MPKNKKTPLHSRDLGVTEMMPEFESVNSVAKVEKPDVLSDLPSIKTPRWDHWYQRKLARAWQATLLGMNIEPVPQAPLVLKANDPDSYRVYKDRLDITMTLIGYEIAYLEDHVREGKGAKGKYIELTEYYKYATRLKWTGLEPMLAGLKINDAPPVLTFSQRKVDNCLSVLDVVMQNCIGSYLNANLVRRPTAVIDWFKEKDAQLPISESTLRNWLIEMAELEDKRKNETS